MQQDLSQLEDMVNQWLDDNSGIQIIQLAQTEIGSRRGRDFVVTILYSESPDS
jgi:hypothetical protein